MTKHTLSGGAMSTASHTARESLLGLKKPRDKIKISFLRCFGGCLHTPGAIVGPLLPDLVHQAATMV